MRAPKTSVLFMESDDILRAGGVAVLEADGRFSVGRAKTPQEARLEWSLRPAVVLLPVDRPAFDPVEWLDFARTRPTSRVVLVVDDTTNPAYVRSLLPLGAVGYVARSLRAASLPELMTTVLRDGALRAGRGFCEAMAAHELCRVEEASFLTALSGVSATGYAAVVGRIGGESDAEIAARIGRAIRSVRDARNEARKILLQAGFEREDVETRIRRLRLAERTAGRYPLRDAPGQ